MAAAVSWKPNFYKPKKTALENILKTISVNFHLNRSSCFGCRAGTKTLHGQTDRQTHRHTDTHTDTLGSVTKYSVKVTEYKKQSIKNSCSIFVLRNKT